MLGNRVPAHKIIFGSMRMHEYDYSLQHWAGLFSKIHDFGIEMHHTSSEYESFPMYLDALDAFRKSNPEKKIRHIVKLAEPDFHLTEFDSTLLNDKVDFYLDKLKTDKLFCVQWMWRGTLSDHPRRLQGFESQYPKIGEAIRKLKSDGKIENFHCFPYDVEFAEAAVSKNDIDGLIVYRNQMEPEFTDALSLASSLNKKSYIIRPLFGGKALETGNDAASLIDWALDFPDIEGAILSISSLEKIQQII